MRHVGPGVCAHGAWQCAVRGLRSDRSSPFAFGVSGGLGPSCLCSNLFVHRRRRRPRGTRSTPLRPRRVKRKHTLYNARASASLLGSQSHAARNFGKASRSRSDLRHISDSVTHSTHPATPMLWVSSGVWLWVWQAGAQRGARKDPRPAQGRNRNRKPQPQGATRPPKLGIFDFG